MWFFFFCRAIKLTVNNGPYVTIYLGHAYAYHACFLNLIRKAYSLKCPFLTIWLFPLIIFCPRFPHSFSFGTNRRAHNHLADEKDLRSLIWCTSFFCLNKSQHAKDAMHQILYNDTLFKANTYKLLNSNQPQYDPKSQCIYIYIYTWIFNYPMLTDTLNSPRMRK